MMVIMMMMTFQGYCWAWQRATLGGSWVLHFLGVAPAGNPLFASISRLLQHAGEHSGSILFTPKPQRWKLETAMEESCITAFSF